LRSRWCFLEGRCFLGRRWLFFGHVFGRHFGLLPCLLGLLGFNFLEELLHLVVARIVADEGVDLLELEGVGLEVVVRSREHRCPVHPDLRQRAVVLHPVVAQKLKAQVAHLGGEENVAGAKSARV
jgi:hypothetical protein